MSYLLDKKIRRNKFFKYALFVAIALFLVYFRAGIWNGLSSFSAFVFRPIFVFGNNIGEKVSELGVYFYSKESLSAENVSLKERISEKSSQMENYNTILAENTGLKEILGRKPERKDFLLSAILSKPDKSLYDTLVLDAGSNLGVKIGARIFALGNIPLGYIAEVYSNTSRAILYSNPRENTEVVVSGRDTFMELLGRGGGNFEMILPRDFSIPVGTEATLPGMNPYVVASVKTIISDPRDSYQKALLISPVNVFELKFVEIESGSRF